MNRKKLKALAEMEDRDDRPGVEPVDQDDIREWAEDPNGGGLPGPSADAFANWLDDAFFSFNEEGDKTNEEVLKGARAHWIGGA